MEWLFKRQADTPQLMTPEQRQAALDAITVPEAMRYNDWQTGSSSWITALRYNPIANYAQMRTKSKGKVYTFGGMTFVTFLTWFKSGSWGKFFNNYLKGKYTQWSSFQSVGEGIAANRARAAGISVLSELGMR
jgi:hypothetical protein